MLDLIIIVFLGIGAFSGFKKGFFTGIVGILAFFIAVIGAFKLLHTGIDFLVDRFGYFSHLLPFIAFILIFLAIILLINIFAKIIKQVLDLTLLGSVDNLAGAILGIFKWAIILSILIWLSNTVGISVPTSWRNSSYLYSYISPIGPIIFNAITSLLPFTTDLFDNISELIRPPVN